MEKESQEHKSRRGESSYNFVSFSLKKVFEPEYNMADDEDDGLWEKPAWAKGGVKLKSTGKGDAMKKDGNLAAPITFTPFKNEDHSNKVANSGRLQRSEVGERMKTEGNLAMPITNIRDEMKKFKKEG